MKKKVSQHLTSISELLDFLGKEEVVYLQVHDFPDADAVASAFALQNLFRYYAIDSRIISVRHIGKSRLKKLITDLEIIIQPIAALGRMWTRDKIVLVDGCKGNANVTDLKEIRGHKTEYMETTGTSCNIILFSVNFNSLSAIFTLWQELRWLGTRHLAGSCRIGNDCCKHSGISSFITSDMQYRKAGKQNLTLSDELS